MTDDQVRTLDPDADAARPDDMTVDELPAAESPEDWSSWSNLWQVPTIVASLVLIAAGVLMATRRGPENDFDGALDQVDELIATGDLDPARARLTDGIEPHLDEATEAHRARFHAVQADWLDAFQRSAGVRAAEHDRSIDEEYQLAVDLGLTMSPARLEQWADALISLDELERARERLEELEALSVAAGSDSPIRRRRNRVLRSLIERSLHNGSGSFPDLMAVLERYRSDQLIDLDDQLWAAMREAELRIADGRFTEAIDRLLLESRRLQRQAEADGTMLDFSGIHVLLGEGYYHLGNHDYATFNLQRALEIAPPAHPRRGAALLLLGHIAMAQDRMQDARSYYEDVVRDYLATESELPARLGLAEVLGVLGEHDRSLEGFRAVHDRLDRAGPCCGVDADRVAGVLTDRAAAALVSGRLELALSHLQVTAELYPETEVPGPIVEQLGAVHVEIAERILDEALAGSARRERPVDRADRDWASDLAAIPPEPAARAQAHLRDAGEAFVRHLRAVVGAPDGDEQWARSLWQAAWCFDNAGDPDLAIRHYREFLAGRPDDDPQRAGALLGLAQSLHALQQYGEAIAAYQELLAQFPTSNEAYRSYVPLARAHLAVEQPAEARQLLQDVVAGNRGLDPQAWEYGDALIELGKLLHHLGQTVPAIERLSEAVHRYPDDPRMPEVRYWLADSYRLRAIGLEAELERPTARDAVRREPLARARREALREAAMYFATVKADLASRDPAGLDRLQRDLLLWSFQYEADCVFRLGDYEQAVGLYEQVVRQYPEHHAALNALVQIFNCYTALDETDRALHAHDRAMARLARLPDSAFESDDALLDREAWQRWLASRPLGGLQSAAN
ncbi:MAG: tetratricopeptide repeat protein [Planctomycetota bacterium]